VVNIDCTLVASSLPVLFYAVAKFKQAPTVLQPFGLAVEQHLASVLVYATLAIFALLGLFSLHAL